MRAVLRIGSGGIALIAAALALGGCGGGSAPLETEGKAAHETAAARPAARRTVIGHRLGSTRVEAGRQLLPARPCGGLEANGTVTVRVLSDTGLCVRVAPGERLRFDNDTGIGPRHAGATAVRVMVGDYELRIRPRQSGLIPSPVETYLGRGSHRVRIAGAPGATILLLPPVCAMHPPVAPGEELCFR